MAFESESLRGYSLKTHKHDSFVCCYCGLDGKESFEKWLTLTQDHLLPSGHPKRDEPEFICTACAICNSADNHYFEKERREGRTFDGFSRQQLIERRKASVLKVREEFRHFWKDNVSTVHA